MAKRKHFLLKIIPLLTFILLLLPLSSCAGNTPSTLFQALGLHELEEAYTVTFSYALSPSGDLVQLPEDEQTVFATFLSDASVSKRKILSLDDVEVGSYMNIRFTTSTSIMSLSWPSRMTSALVVHEPGTELYISYQIGDDDLSILQDYVDKVYEQYNR